MLPFEGLKRVSFGCCGKLPASLFKSTQGSHPEKVTLESYLFFLKYGCSDCGHYTTLKINSQQLKCNENTQILKKPEGPVNSQGRVNLQKACICILIDLFTKSF